MTITSPFPFFPPFSSSSFPPPPAPPFPPRPSSTMITSSSFACARNRALGEYWTSHRAMASNVRLRLKSTARTRSTPDIACFGITLACASFRLRYRV
eukprot:205744-Rhodomonas_salina.1